MDRSLFHSPKTLLDRLRNRSPPTVDDPAHAHHLVYACGYNTTGQLGCGDRESRVVPWRVRTSRLGKGRVDLAIGSALDIFGGALPYTSVLAWKPGQAAA